MKTKFSKFISISFLMLFASSIAFAQTDYSLARVKKSTGKLIFFHNEPVEQYDVQFTFVDIIPDQDCMTLDQICNVAVINASVEAGSQNKLYDAIILGTGDRDIAITFSDKAKDNSVARVEKTDGKYVFFRCDPIANYEIIKQYPDGSLEKLLHNQCAPLQDKIDIMVKKNLKAEDRDPYSGILIGAAGESQLINFNDSASINTSNFKIGDKVTWKNTKAISDEPKFLTGVIISIKLDDETAIVKKDENDQQYAGTVEVDFDKLSKTQ